MQSARSFSVELAGTVAWLILAALPSEVRAQYPDCPADRQGFEMCTVVPIGDTELLIYDDALDGSAMHPNAPIICWICLAAAQNYGYPTWTKLFPGDAYYDHDWDNYGFDPGILWNASEGEVLGLIIHEMVHKLEGAGAETLAVLLQDQCVNGFSG